MRCFFTSIFCETLPGNLPKYEFHIIFKKTLCSSSAIPTQSSAVPVDMTILDVRSWRCCCFSADLVVWQWRLTSEADSLQ